MFMIWVTIFSLLNMSLALWVAIFFCYIASVPAPLCWYCSFPLHCYGFTLLNSCVSVIFLRIFHSFIPVSVKNPTSLLYISSFKHFSLCRLALLLGNPLTFIISIFNVVRLLHLSSNIGVLRITFLISCDCLTCCLWPVEPPKSFGVIYTFLFSGIIPSDILFPSIKIIMRSVYMCWENLSPDVNVSLEVLSFYHGVPVMT